MARLLIKGKYIYSHKYVRNKSRSKTRDKHREQFLPSRVNTIRKLERLKADDGRERSDTQ